MYLGEERHCESKVSCPRTQRSALPRLKPGLLQRTNHMHRANVPSVINKNTVYILIQFYTDNREVQWPNGLCAGLQMEWQFRALAGALDYVFSQDTLLSYSASLQLDV